MELESFWQLFFADLKSFVWIFMRFLLRIACMFQEIFPIAKACSVQENYTFASRAQRMPNSASVAC